MRNETMVRLRGQRTRKEVATALGIPVSTYTRIEKGKQDPILELRDKIAHFFNVSVGELFFDWVSWAEKNGQQVVTVRLTIGEEEFDPLTDYGYGVMIRENLCLYVENEFVSLEEVKLNPEHDYYETDFAVFFLKCDFETIYHDLTNMSALDFITKYLIKEFRSAFRGFKLRGVNE